MNDTVRMQQEAEARVRAANEARRRLIAPHEATPAEAPDGEQALVLILLLLLMQNGAPAEVVMALLYIAL